MAAKLCFAAASLIALFAHAHGAFLSAAVPTYEVDVSHILTTLAALDSKGLDDKELEDVEASIQDLVSKDKDPVTKFAVKQLSDFMSKTLIPNRMKRQQQDQEQLDAKMAELNQCDVEEQAKRDAMHHSRLTTAKQHKEDYQDSMASYGACVEELDSKALLKDAYCHSIDEKKVCHCHDVMLKHFGPRNENCKSYPPIAAENQKCCDTYAEHEKHHAACVNAHLDATYASKQHRIIMGNLCDVYGKCYDEKLEAYKVVEKRMKLRDSHRAWGAVFRIECLIAAFETGKVSKSRAMACKEKREDHQGIVFQTIPTKDRCYPEIQA